jgi:hypothetical protein
MTDSQAPMNLLELFDDAQFPTTKAELVSHAEDNDASEDALDMLQALPQNRYETLEDLNKDMGKIKSIPGQENLWSSQKPENQSNPQPHDIASRL